MTRLGFCTWATALLCACVLSTASRAQSDTSDLVPLQSYIQQNNITNDPVAAEYVALRCVAFYRAGAAAMDSKTDPQMLPLKRSALARATDLMDTVVALDVTRSGRSQKDSATAMNAAASLMGRAYTARMKADKKESGDIGKDPVFTGDSDICRALPLFGSR